MKPFAAVIRAATPVEGKRQADAIGAWAASNGVRLRLLEPEIRVGGYDEFVDRATVREAVEGIETGTFAGLVAVSLTVIARSAPDLVGILRRIEAAGGRAVFLQESIDSETPEGRFQLRVLRAIEELLTSEREG